MKTNCSKRIDTASIWRKWTVYVVCVMLLLTVRWRFCRRTWSWSEPGRLGSPLLANCRTLALRWEETHISTKYTPLFSPPFVVVCSVCIVFSLLAFRSALTFSVRFCLYYFNFWLYCILFIFILCFSEAAGLLQQTNFSYGGLIKLHRITAVLSSRLNEVLHGCTLRWWAEVWFLRWWFWRPGSGSGAASGTTPLWGWPWVRGPRSSTAASTTPSPWCVNRWAPPGVRWVWGGPVRPCTPLWNLFNRKKAQLYQTVLASLIGSLKHLGPSQILML